jgi:hypothetical protein
MKTITEELMNLTDNEREMLKAFWNESMDCCGAFDKYENMSWMSGADLMKTLGKSKHSIGGTMASLEAKYLISDSGESARGASGNDYTLNYTKEIAEFCEELEREELEREKTL